MLAIHMNKMENKKEQKNADYNALNAMMRKLIATIQFISNRQTLKHFTCCCHYQKQLKFQYLC